MVDYNEMSIEELKDYTSDCKAEYKFSVDYLRHCNDNNMEFDILMDCAEEVNQSELTYNEARSELEKRLDVPEGLLGLEDTPIELDLDE